jgi:hypothetical protein
MNCESVTGNIPAIVSGGLSAERLADSRRHIAECRSCCEALRGAEAFAILKRRETGVPPADLFDRIRAGLVRRPARTWADRRFWQGTGFGGAIAASLLAITVTMGWIGPPAAGTPEVGEFTVALRQPQMMDIAIEADRPLQNARISVFLAGGIELDGYGDRRELSWAADLKAGVNRLSLPVIALDERGGRVLVRLVHPQSEQMFVVRLKTEA